MVLQVTIRSPLPVHLSRLLLKVVLATTPSTWLVRAVTGATVGGGAGNDTILLLLPLPLHLFG